MELINGSIAKYKIVSDGKSILRKLFKNEFKPVTRNLGRIIAATWDDWTDKIMAIVSF